LAPLETPPFEVTFVITRVGLDGLEVLVDGADVLEMVEVVTALVAVSYLLKSRILQFVEVVGDLKWQHQKWR